MTSIVNCNVMDEHILLCIDSLVVVDCCQLLSRCVCCLFRRQGEFGILYPRRNVGALLCPFKGII